MTTNDSGIKRRQFLKTIGAAGIGGVVGATTSPLGLAAAPMQVGTRPFGRTGIQVPILSLGTMFDTGANQLLLRQAVKWGVTYWDTAQYYNRWGSEPGIGKYFAKYPEDRKKIFLVSKSIRRNVKLMAEDFNNSLANLKTDYLDLFFVHAVDHLENEITDDIVAWGKKMKAQGKIRLFGFSTHQNMAKNLALAPSAGWVDAIMTTYNYKVMVSDEMKRAVDACHKAGIALTAMKTQGVSPWRSTGPSTPEGEALAKRFMAKGITEEQARLLAVWSDERIAAVCSQMNTLAILKANTEAAVRHPRLSAADRRCFEAEAMATAAQYCTGCTGNCQPALTAAVPVGKIMRCLMYSRSYGDHFHARVEFQDVPASVRAKLASLDYTAAEKRCPQGMPIGRLMAEAADELT